MLKPKNIIKTLSEVCERNRPMHNSCYMIGVKHCKTLSNALFTVTLFPPRAKWQILSILYLSCSASTVLSEIDTQDITNPYLKENEWKLSILDDMHQCKITKLNKKSLNIRCHLHPFLQAALHNGYAPNVPE